MGRRAVREGVEKVYTGDELTCIGMPVGGICAGSFICGAMGRWPSGASLTSIASRGYGDNCYRTYTPPSPVEQGFGLAVTPDGGRTVYRTLNRRGFPRIEFTGEYPIGTVRYRTTEGDADPVEVVLEAFSPFVPLGRSAIGDAGDDSAFPGEKPLAETRARRAWGLDSKPGRAAARGALSGDSAQSHYAFARVDEPGDDDRGSAAGRPPARSASRRCLPISRGTRTANGERPGRRSAIILRTARCPVSKRSAATAGRDSSIRSCTVTIRRAR